MELVHYFGWVEGPSKQTDRNDGGWVQKYLWCQGWAIKGEIIYVLHFCVVEVCFRGGGGGGGLIILELILKTLLKDLCSTGKNTWQDFCFPMLQNYGVFTLWKNSSGQLSTEGLQRVGSLFVMCFSSANKTFAFLSYLSCLW